jgi:hydrogenase maturation protease
MAKKVIAIGNILMGDDSIGIRVLEKIADSLKSYGIASFIGETDFEYCISEINEGDSVIIIDAAVLGKKVGTITAIPIEGCIDYKESCTEHSNSLFNMLDIYFRNIKVYVIGIEIENITYDLSISRSLELSLQEISQTVLNKILEMKAL